MRGWRSLKFRFAIYSLIGLSFLAFAYGVDAAPPARTPDEGQKIFQEKCVGCHTIGKGKLVGPDLQGVTQKQTKAWLTQWISAPDKMLAAKDPIAMQLFAEYNNIAMPNMGLTEAQVAALIAYLETQSAGGAPAAQTTPPQPQPQPASAALVADPAAGKTLFTGAQRLQNGGPPCMGCHSVGGIGALGGGVLGPDLTGAYAKYNGDAGLTAFLNSVPTVTMNAVWARQPLTPQEQANLVAFLKQVSVTERPIDAVGQLAVLAVVGTIVLLLIAQLYWRKRLVAVRRPMVLKSKT
ncbi:MAG: c-type cytochrome [Chloroflexota bacterium]|nr:c-type cytochrome [Chloroflexota bacterium]